MNMCINRYINSNININFKINIKISINIHINIIVNIILLLTYFLGTYINILAKLFIFEMMFFEFNFKNLHNLNSLDLPNKDSPYFLPVYK